MIETIWKSQLIEFGFQTLLLVSCGCAAFSKNERWISRSTTLNSLFTMVSNLNVDYITKRLLVLVNNDDKCEQDINDIIVHINEKAPQLLEDLSIDSKRRIAKSIQIKCYEDNEGEA